MVDSRYDELIFEFVEFIFHIVERLLNTCVSCLIIYGILYIIFRYLIFKNRASDWAMVAKDIGDGVRDAVAAFKNAMPAVKELAKSWADATVARLRRSNYEQ